MVKFPECNVADSGTGTMDRSLSALPDEHEQVSAAPMAHRA